MKKYIYTVALALAAVVSSCSKSDDFATTQSSQQVTFTLAAAQPQTRATETVTLSRYVMEVYEDAACNTPALVFENGTANHKEQSSPAFTLILDKTKSYTCLFWADDDASAAVYNVASLKSVTLVTDAEPVEGFFATQTVNSEAASYNIAMNRAVAKVVLMEKDKIKAASSLVTSFNHCTTFNVKDGSATDSKSKTITTTITDAINGTSEAPATVASFYTLAPAEGTTVNFSFTLNNESTKTVSNAPLKANFVTSLKGEFSGLTSKTFIATASDDWAGGYDEVIEPFADPAFKAALVELGIPVDAAGNIDYTDPTTLTALRAITELDVQQKGIYSLKGIEYMTNLENLHCQYNNLTHLDVSGLTNLKYLSCDNNNISSLDVSTLTQLRCIYCYVNKLTSLDITKNANLAEVCCGAQRDNATLNLTLLSSQQSMWENTASYSSNTNVTPIYQD